MFRQLLQTLEQRGHVQVGQISELIFRFVLAKTIFSDCLELPVILSHAPNNDHVLGSWLQCQGRVQRFLRLRYPPPPGEVRAELELAHHLLCNSTENNRNSGEKFIVRCDHEFQWFESD